MCYFNTHGSVKAQESTLALYRPDGQCFETYRDLLERAEQERLRAERLAAQLCVLGIEPKAASCSNRRYI
jgi:hypothetical protein